jgi:SAM-dependent methyltransferase
MTTNELEMDFLRNNVRKHYSKIATDGAGCGCAPACCSPTDETVPNLRTPDQVSQALGYSARDTATVPEGANLGVGCGNPLAIASLKPGQTVLDLGSGAGFDSFLAANAVGPSGSVSGVDMTPEMLSKARLNKTKGGFHNVEFRLGEIENLPVVDNSIDVILSNCVINLSPDKGRVFQEAFRVLKPGGRLAISDVVATASLPPALRQDLELHAGCVAGASLVDNLQQLLESAGFSNIRIEPRPQSRDSIREWFPGRGVEDYVVSATIEATKPAADI